ncbi:head-tail connector protein [uncultured Sphingomonas sp.]|uniref:head-tail connector protein n=1 Tax=uncultured Sphingomonas sp. TaxID=158754 RepID=UPI0025DCB134|nr:head-tail connector protein [uncultured Sphingomonas sp.]
MTDVAAIDGTVLTVAAARIHLRVGSKVTDAELSDLVVAAQGRIESFLGRELVGATGWATVDAVPALVRHCVKLALSDFYVNREAPQLTDEQLRPIIGSKMLVTIG